MKRGRYADAHPPGMGSVDRAMARAERRARRTLHDLGDVAREARVGAGLSQGEVGRAVGMSVSAISRFERAELGSASIVQATRIAGVLGLDLRVNAYPGGEPLRDEAHAKRLSRLLGHVGPPLRYRVDAPLPPRPDGPPEQRAWDVLLHGGGRRTGVSS